MATDKTFTPTTAEAEKAEATDKVKNALYGKATTALREAHKDEFETILEGLYKKKGLVRKRRLSEAERAEQTVRDLLSQHPDLLAKVTPQPEDTTGPV